MRKKPLSVRGFVLILIAALVSASSGCVTAERRANRQWGLVSEGMTRDDVESVLGQADSQFPSPVGESWHYSYGSRPDPSKIATMTGQVLAVLTVIVGFMLLLAYDRSGAERSGPDFTKFWPEGDASTSSRRVHFTVNFDVTGKVRWVSGIEPCTE